MPGTWNDASYAQYHTQSTRTRQFGGGANGGLDDRFDLILMSQAVIDAGGMQYDDGTYIPYGNDGLHYNDSINQPPNNAVGQEIANALHYSSDHLPVMASFTFTPVVPVELISFSAAAQNGDVLLSWTTATETNNSGFEVQRKAGNTWEKISFIHGAGNSTQRNYYSYGDKQLNPDLYQYRLKQIDYDGSYHYSGVAEVKVAGPDEFSLFQNYPNPFNPSTTIKLLSSEGRKGRP